MISSESNLVKAQKMLEKDFEALIPKIKSVTKSSLERLLIGASGIIVAEELLKKKNTTQFDEREIEILQIIQRVQENILALTLDGSIGGIDE